MEPPAFPADFVIERVRRLGYGTTWTREQLVSMMNETTADKFIRDARAAGWLVSPGRGVYTIPPASDLMTVSWLSQPFRDEFLMGRGLAAANIRAWCLSAWCREQGLDLGGPLFVTDLQERRVPTVRDPRSGETKDVYVAPPSASNLRGEALTQAQARAAVPFLEGLIIVPFLPPLKAAPALELFELPEDPATEQRRRTKGALGAGLLSAVSLAVWTFTKAPPPGFDKIGQMLEFGRPDRSIPYTLGPRTDDDAWIIGVLAALGLARGEELAVKIAEGRDRSFLARAQENAALIGPPQPNAEWKTTLQEGPFPFLLVPRVLWKQMGPEQAARRSRTLARLVGDVRA